MISVKDVQPWKAHASMFVGGSVISVKDVQPAKADNPIVVRLGGSVISAKDVQPEKAYSPILVRVGGSVILVSVQFNPRRPARRSWFVPLGTVLRPCFRFRGGPVRRPGSGFHGGCLWENAVDVAIA